MSDEPTARERAEKLAVQYAAEECLFAATDAIEAALTAAEQRGREAALAPRLALLESALKVCVMAQKCVDYVPPRPNDVARLQAALAAHHALLDTGR